MDATNELDRIASIVVALLALVDGEALPMTGWLHRRELLAELANPAPDLLRRLMRRRLGELPRNAAADLLRQVVARQEFIVVGARLPREAGRLPEGRGLEGGSKKLY